MSVAMPADIAGAVDRLARYFGGDAIATTRQGILAREALGEPVDTALSERLLVKLQAELRPDGIMGGGVVPTIWRAQEFMDLGRGADQPGTARVLRWILQLQKQAGAFGEGCSPERHRYRICQHYVAGFFSPSPAEQRIAPITLPNGKVFRVEAPARFAISCLALRAVLRAEAGHHRLPLVEQHLRSLAQMSELWTGWADYFPPDAIIAGLHALAYAPASYRKTVPRLLALVAEHQDQSGLWPNTDLFPVLEALLDVGTAEAQAMVRRALPALVERQRPDGTFGATAQAERAWIGLQALLWGR
jgi:hypothetical protein